MSSLEKYSVIYVDVDGTLLLWPGGKPGRPPRKNDPDYGKPPAINKFLAESLARWHRVGNTLVLWSRGGEEHCEKAARLCGLNPDACLPKPYAAIDDAPTTVTRNERKGFVVLDPHSLNII